MEVDGIQTQACKLSRIGNSRDNSNKIGRKGGNQFQDEEEESGEGNRANDTNNAIVGGFHVGSENGRLQAWHSSRIFRVSRASGGKDRHSKVLTAKGLRDRRVRLSVSTAIQFYDLQDRLGYDQPSKAVEWLIKAASVAIADLPPLNTTFPETPKQLSDEKRANKDPRFDRTEMELDADLSFQQQQHNISLSKSGCSSTSETSKGSGLSLSRSDIRVKARERARERTAKDKEKEKPEEPHRSTHHQQNALSSSFTELLTGCAQNSHSSPSLSAAQQNSNFSNFAIKQNRYIPSTHETDYFTSGLFGSSSMRSNPYSSGFPGQTHFANASPIPQFSVTGDHHQEQHQFFLSDHMTDAAAAAAGASGNEYNLNFTIAPGIAGFNRGTLQSNSTQSPLPHLQQRLSSPADGPSMPFFIGNLGSASAAPPIDNQFSSRFDRGLHLYYGHDERHSDLKGKDKG